jgi:hypothetical protein
MVLILLKNPVFFEISQTASEMLEKLSLQNALQSILEEWVDRFSGVFNCSFLISWGFSAESKLGTDPFTEPTPSRLLHDPFMRGA